MATKHVIAYVMHEAERDLAAREVENAQVTDSYVIGDIDENRIQELEGADPPPTPWHGAPCRLSEASRGGSRVTKTRFRPRTPER